MPNNWANDDTFKLPPVLDELILSINRDNYNQNLDTNALVCLTSTAALVGKVWHIKEGNVELCKRLLTTAQNNDTDNIEINIKLQHTATKIVKNDKNINQDVHHRYKIGYFEGSNANNVTHEYYDIIIIATPIQFTKISFDGFGTKKTNPKFFDDLEKIDRLNYHNVISTFVKGKLNFSYFVNDINSSSITNDTFYQFTEFLIGNNKYSNDMRKFNFIARKIDLSKEGNNSEPGLGIYKFFSQKNLSSDDLNEIFETYDKDSIIAKRYKAYPTFPIKAEFPSIILDGRDSYDDGLLYYINGVEPGTSAMEIIAMSAKNLANLIDEFIRFVLERQEFPFLAPSGVPSGVVKEEL